MARHREWQAEIHQGWCGDHHRDTRSEGGEQHAWLGNNRADCTCLSLLLQWTASSILTGLSPYLQIQTSCLMCFDRRRACSIRYTRALTSWTAALMRLAEELGQLPRLSAACCRTNPHLTLPNLAWSGPALDTITSLPAGSTFRTLHVPVHA